MSASSGNSLWVVGMLCFMVILECSSTSESDCRSYRTDALGNYQYPMQELADNVTSFNFSVRVMKYAYVVLSRLPQDIKDQYEIAIGNSEPVNTASIRRCQKCEDRQSATTDNPLLEVNTFKPFWVSFKSGTIQIGRRNESAFISWTDLHPLDIRFIGISTGIRLPGDFIFCDLRFRATSTLSLEGLFVLCILFLPAMAMVMRSYLKGVKRKWKRSNNNTRVDSFDEFYTTGIENPTGPQSEDDLPTYDKCMEDNNTRLYFNSDNASTSSEAMEHESEPPPSYEAAVAIYLFNMNCESQSAEKCSISMWDSATASGRTDDLETFV